MVIPAVPSVRYNTIGQPFLLGINVKSRHPKARSRIVSRRGWRIDDLRHFRAEGVISIMPTNRAANDVRKALADKVISDRKNLTWINIFWPSALWIYFIL